ncbi:putative metallocarboxypeptidase-like protein [Emericellopsis cladophorae]|uniref:Inactive metallocarboxypeptidase ECM14 n=1 Tax=Emericellopsis cladophorae TaxID=2686198 RepID=A0A9P9Y499_9HYPO|nr:putative metallocarboxypeptidase-like protein [Emericellopsis cladophorae]KAI6783191.1 putative metallocarboxypeptidase-like protein [Emericellopsis cladophorae]
MKLGVAACIAPLIFASAVGSVGTGAQTESRATSVHGNKRLFPWLTKLRDGTVEAIFGRHPHKPVLVPGPIRAQYADQLVLRLNLSSAADEEALGKAVDRLFLDVWSYTQDYVDIRLGRNEVKPLLGLLPETLHSSYSVLIPDLAAAVYRSQSSSEPETTIMPETMYADLELSETPADRAGDILFFQDYQPLPVIIRWMQLLEAMFPSYVRYITIGKSFEDRDIPALRVGLPVSSGTATARKTIVVTGGLHGREWISTTSVNYLAWAFITSFGKERLITKLLEHFDIVFVPAVNPDGVEYTWNVDRLWRKTRQQTNLRYCRGYDLDHAFGFEWDRTGTQNDPCSESYGGEHSFQAVEAMRLAEWAKNETALNNVKFVGLLDLHSYSQQVLFPYSYTCDVDPPNLENLEELAAGIAKAIRLSNGESYSVTSACKGAVTMSDGGSGSHKRVEPRGGSAIDWFYHELRAHFSYQIKLRDTGAYGFLLPKEHIIPTGEEIFDAMKYFGDYLLGNNGIEHLSDPGSVVQHAAESETKTDPGLEMDGMELRRRKSRR